MFQPKSIAHDSVAGALSKAERYRLLNEPGEAESICLDILEIEPDNQQALVSLVLALTDQIPHSTQAFQRALDTAKRLSSGYDRAYYAGIAWERRAKARHHAGGPGGRNHVYDWIVLALKLYEEAESLRAPGNDDALLRWNACVRFLAANRDLAPSQYEAVEPIASE